MDVSIRKTLEQEPWSNLIGDTNGRDNPQDGFEMTKTIWKLLGDIRGLLCDIDRNGGSPKHRALAVSPRN